MIRVSSEKEKLIQEIFAKKELQKFREKNNEKSSQKNTQPYPRYRGIKK